MNVLFLCLSKVWDISEREIHSDLLREFIRRGHDVYVVTPVERRFGEKTTLLKQKGAQILKVRTLNIQKTNIIEKGLGTVLIESQYLRAIKRFFCDVHFDLVMYATPPITLARPIRYIKKRDGASSYLLLKDIFPQNAVDIGLMKKTGVKGLLYRLFAAKEKKLYAVSDYIGCMSQANVTFLCRNNPQINRENVEISPNCTEMINLVMTPQQKNEMRRKYRLPTDKTVFVYGGNLGAPQNIPFVVECLRELRDETDLYFLIVGDGTAFGTLDAYIKDEKPANVTLLSRLPKEDYDALVAACDVGMIFLDYRFTVPNFPSRLLVYMLAGLPVLACTDKSSDVGTVVSEGGFGVRCDSDSPASFVRGVKQVLPLCGDETVRRRELAYVSEHYSTAKQYEIIMRHFAGTEGDQ